MKTPKSIIPNAITLTNVAMGVLGIVFVAHEQMISAVICVGVALVLDFLDGFVARILRAQSDLGMQLDSLADMVTFGALPGYIMFEMIAVTKGLHFVDISQWSTTDLLQCSVALLIPVGAALRLGTFNLDLTKRDHFLGLPVPAMTIMVVAVPIVLEAHYSLNFYVKISDSFIDTIGAARRWDPSDYVVVKLMYQPLFYQISSAILAAMMVIRIPMLSLKFKGLSWSKNKWRYGIFIWLAICYIIFLVPYTDIFILDFGLIDFLILPIFMFGYFVLSWIYAIFGASKSDSKLHEIQS